MNTTENQGVQYTNPAPRQENKKIVAGVLALLIGPLGVHKFVLGY